MATLTAPTPAADNTNNSNSLGQLKYDTLKHQVQQLKLEQHNLASQRAKHKEVGAVCVDQQHQRRQH